MTDDEKWEGAERRAWVEARVEDLDPEVLFFDDLDHALIGYVTQAGGRALAVYDEERAIKALMDNSSWTRDEAMEWFLYNTADAYVGEHTPVIFHPIGEEP
jgi:hypothetical protein